MSVSSRAVTRPDRCHQFITQVVFNLPGNIDGKMIRKIMSKRSQNNDRDQDGNFRPDPIESRFLEKDQVENRADTERLPDQHPGAEQ